jgi:hypothetical protein
MDGPREVYYCPLLAIRGFRFPTAAASASTQLRVPHEGSLEPLDAYIDRDHPPGCTTVGEKLSSSMVPSSVSPSVEPRIPERRSVSHQVWNLPLLPSAIGRVGFRAPPQTGAESFCVAALVAARHGRCLERYHRG